MKQMKYIASPKVQEQINKAMDEYIKEKYSLNINDMKDKKIRAEIEVSGKIEGHEQLFAIPTADWPKVNFHNRGYESTKGDAIIFDPKGKEFNLSVGRNGIHFMGTKITCPGIVEIYNFDTLNISIGE